MTSIPVTNMLTPWVGVNCYASKYFQGRVWQGESRYNEVCFKTGYSSDPVVMIKDAVEKYGGRKPIMISECGSAYRTNGDINETDSEWADKIFKTNIYIHSYGISSSKAYSVF